ncbi:uncharacterized protein SETTUDRAFT_150406 [Exserohilum turcica Et28A]|uniref:Uncharacterized protein n=1 Tax=Exserohilum turcicum (strain 28A) TaxID=671987 RepID=R0ISH0_EXST2|nr:uncharacterized protein SETTUDRAFT_150406 [Exserohilum turcica Et28A]EOA87790.1 hypothetical protein SETTUDRAFT_150406 [Exserohilum turcica Et28A]
MLHSAVWYHAACDLSLQGSEAASSIPGNTSDNTDHGVAERSPSSSTRTNENILLDFLYPDKTLALLRSLSVDKCGASEPKRRLLHTTTGARHFSTLRPQILHNGDNTDADAVEQARKEAARLAARSDAAKELKKIARHTIPGKQEVAWQLYTSIPEDQLMAQPDIRCHLLDILARDMDTIVPGRVLQVFNEMPLKARYSSSYRAAVRAYVALRMIGPAIKLLEDMDPSVKFKTLHIGIDAILQRTVADEQWDLTFRVFRLFLRRSRGVHGQSTYPAIRQGNTLPELWHGVAQLPELLEHLQSFFRHVREFQHELTSSPQMERDLACFIMTFVPHVMDKVLDTQTPDEDFIWDFFVKLFDDLHSLNLPTPACYEYAIKRMLELPRYQEYTNQRKIWLELYLRYRSRYVDDPKATSETRPSENLVRNLIHQYSRMGGWRRVEEFIQDLRTFYPVRPLRPGLLKQLIQAHAIAGDEEKVNQYIKELEENYKDEVSLQVLSALPYVNARRADVEGTIRQFNRIHTEYNMVPDIACWNILLLAYVRADDLDGALECFNNCMEYGLVPDEKTFGPLLDFCAQRGDVEAFETLFSRAKQFGLHLDTDVRARSGYVHAFLNAGDPEGADAIAGGMLKSWNEGTLYGHPLTHTWNLLIQQYALNSDLAGSRQRYRQMIENNIPLDSWTYGSLMRALIEVKQTNAAYKILRVTMPEHGMRVHALHYAVVITGFLREGQIDQALSAYERMMERNVPQTKSSREASIRALGADDLRTVAKRSANHRLRRVEEALEEILTSSMGEDIAHQQPRHERIMDTHNYGAVPQSYLGLVISLYTARSALKICEKYFEKAEASAPDSDNYISPLTLITTMMEARYKAGNYTEVAKLWELARSSAGRLTKTFHQAVHQTAPDSELDSLLDPAVHRYFQESQISSNRRHILANPARIFIRSLLAQPGPEAVQEAQRTF